MVNHKKMMEFFMWMDKSIFLITERSENKSYKKTMILWILDIQNNKEC